MKIFSKTLLAAGAAFALSACSGDDSSNENTATFNLAVSDAAVDSVDSVVLFYKNAALLPVGSGKPIIVDIVTPEEYANTPITGRVDLLEYQGSDKATVVSALEVPPGDYKLCLFVLDGDAQNQNLSHVVESDSLAIEPLSVEGNGKCPQGVGEEEGSGTLYFNKTFSINTGNNNFVAEFDLRSGLKEPKGNSDHYTIQRTSIQLLNEVETGIIKGSVSNAVVEQCRIDSQVATTVNAVYLYPGDVSIDNMGSFSSNSSNKVSPIAAANVKTDDGIHFEYDLGYIGEGTYSLGYTCVADKDPAVVTESADAGFSLYQAEGPVEVVPEYVTEVNFSEQY